SIANLNISLRFYPNGPAAMAKIKGNLKKTGSREKRAGKTGLKYLKRSREIPNFSLRLPAFER
ncbi:MAG: hypothetical protein ACR2RV_02825, partial [Verrucomicrobiales bacterium]